MRRGSRKPSVLLSPPLESVTRTFIPAPPVQIFHFNSSHSATRRRKQCDVQFPMCFPLSAKQRPTMLPSVFGVTPPAVRPNRSAFIQQGQWHLPAVRPYGAKSHVWKKYAFKDAKKLEWKRRNPGELKRSVTNGKIQVRKNQCSTFGDTSN